MTVCYNFVVSQKKINGTIIHYRRDIFGEITVADDGNARSLYFGDVLQSSIRLGEPETLTEDYNRAMMSALMFGDDPKKILIIGLGGCSLVHFLLRVLPGCCIEVAEIREAVIDIAYDYFFLQKGREDLRIFHASGQDFVGQSAGDYDLVIIDAFDDSGPAAVLLEDDFLSTCRNRMSEKGVCVFNLWSRPKDNFPERYAAIRRAFNGNILKLCPSEAYWNTLVFAFKREERPADLPTRRADARILQKLYQIDLPRYLKYLYWQNWGAGINS
jgi:spermidine synthase